MSNFRVSSPPSSPKPSNRLPCPDEYCPVPRCDNYYKESHFLQACFTCQVRLGQGVIYMYRDEQFCSEKCRKKEMDSDEAKEEEMRLLSFCSKWGNENSDKKRESPSKVHNQKQKMDMVAGAP